MPSTHSLLEASDGSAVQTINAGGASDIVLVCEHASNRVPVTLGTLGLSADALLSHAAWDPGAEAIALLLSKSLDAALVTAGFSRLVYDLNRPPEHLDAMRAVSEIYDIPGNTKLSNYDRQARTDALYRPFHAAIDLTLERYEADNRTPVLVTIHTFTPVYLGEQREVEFGILHDADTRFADEMLLAAPQLTTLKTLRNAPYGADDGVTHTLKMHALPRGILNVMLEIRNDLVTDEQQQINVARDIDALLRTAQVALSRVPAAQPVSAGAPA